MEEKMPYVLSFGGGYDSTALLITIVMDKLPLDWIVFCDTGAEMPYTYKHLDDVDAYLEKNGYPTITRIERRQFLTNRAKLKDMTLEDELFYQRSIPSVAYGYKICSVKYKIEPKKRFLKKMGITKFYNYLGYNFDEVKRKEKAIKGSATNPNETHIFRLIDLEMTRADVIKLVEDTGFKHCRKSACYFCPNSKFKEVIELKKNYPELFEKAITLEKLQREKTAEQRGKDYDPPIKGLGRSKTWSDYIVKYESEIEMDDFFIELQEADGCLGDCGL